MINLQSDYTSKASRHRFLTWSALDEDLHKQRERLQCWVIFVSPTIGTFTKPHYISASYLILITGHLSAMPSRWNLFSLHGFLIQPLIC